MAATIHRKFLAMLWKNFLLKWRHKKWSLAELIMPLLLFLFLAFARSQIKYKPGEKPPFNFTSPKDEFFSNNSGGPGLIQLCTLDREFYVTANDSIVANWLLKEMKTTVDTYCFNISVDQRIRILLAANEQTIVDKFTEQAKMNSSRVSGGVVVESQSGADFRYKLRFGYTVARPETQTQNLYEIPKAGGLDTFHTKRYMEPPTTVFQTLIDLLHIKRVTSASLFPLDEQSAQWMLSEEVLPLPGEGDNSLAAAFDFFLGTFTVIAFAFCVPPLLKRIAEEKQSGVKEFLHMMGLPSSVYWTAWFTTHSIYLFVVVVIIVFCLSSIVESGNIFIILITFLLYTTALILMMFALSTIFTNPNLSMAFGFTVHLLTFFVPLILLQKHENYKGIGIGGKLALCLLPNVAIGWAESGMMLREKTSETLGFQQLWEPLRDKDDDLTLGLVWIMLLADSLIYSLIVYYMDKVKPGPYGTPKPLYFPFMKSYWFGERQTAAFEASSPEDPEHFEPEPNEKPSICVKDLRKEFGSLVAVNSISFNAFAGQITALLGHNGAGKSTTMNMLTGLTPRSGGDAIIGDKKLSTEMGKIRGHLGLCPQNNMLFDDLTVKEHLFLFGMLKGLRWKEAKSESVRIAHLIRLEGKMKERSSKLSGGMKRKLHLGIAVVGQPEVMLLDEPTSGLDPEARREIWDLLQKLKKDSTILLTTHYMEEADVLADRIAIMAEGNIRCNGSSLFLKTAYGIAYRLTVTKAPGCDDRKIAEFIRFFMKDATVLSSAPGEISFGLNAEDRDDKALVSLLRELALRKKSLEYLNFGLQAPSLESVFLRVAEPTDDDEPVASDEVGRRDTPEEEPAIDNGRVPKSRAVGLELWLMQLKALVTKRAIQAKRQWLLHLLLCLIPVAMALAIAALAGKLSLSNMVGSSATPPALLLNLDNQFKASHGDVYSLVNAGPAADVAKVFTDYMTSALHRVKIVNTNDFLGHTVQNSGGIELYGRRYAPSFRSTNYELSLNGTELIVGYNNVPLHGRVMAKNVASNVLLRHLNNQTGSIATTYHPILVQNTWIQAWGIKDSINLSELLYGIFVAIGFILFTSLFAFTHVKERVCNAKQVQIMAGVHPATFWMGNFLWDFGIFLLVSVATCIIFSSWDDRNLFDAGAGATLFLILLMFGLSTIFMAYTCSMIAKSATACFTLYAMASFGAGILVALAVWMFVGNEGLQSSGSLIFTVLDVSRYVVSLIPSLPAVRAIFALIHAGELNGRCFQDVDLAELRSLCKRFRQAPSQYAQAGHWAMRGIASCCHADVLGSQHKDDHICGQTLSYQDEITNQNTSVKVADCFETMSVFTWDLKHGIAIDLLYLLGDIFLFLLILVILESKVFGRFRLWWPFRKSSKEVLDEDVVAEQQAAKRVFNGEASSADVALVAVDLTKNFGSLTAVNGLSFTVRLGECFGLLGVNGAGKTTTFRILTGDERPTKGNSRLLGKDLRGNKREYLRQIGYCPQFDAIIDLLTGREMLALFASIRGIKKSSERQAEIQKWAGFVGIEAKMLDRACGEYSGGNKRRLNLAQALVGDPPMILLDEPTTGVDPVARRKIWSIITKITKEEGQSVVLTSHSMEEVSALADRLAIMTDGQFRCLGGPQYLKNKFGQGFTVIVKMQPAANEEEADLRFNEIIDHMMQKFQDCTVRERHTNYVYFHIGATETPWHYLFETMQAAKKRLPIDDFSIQDTSLEEIFLYFARRQEQIKQIS